MKFIETIKIYITIFALIQLSFSSKLESNSKNKVATESKNSVVSAAKAETKAKTELTSTANSASSLKTSAKTELKAKTALKMQALTSAKTESKAKTELKSRSNLKAKSSAASKRSSIIDINNLFNPNFDINKKDNKNKDPKNSESEKDKKNDSNDNDKNNNDKKITPKTSDQILSDWLMISSQAFRDKSKFPDIFIRQINDYVKIHTDSMDFRINDAHEKDSEQGENAPANANCFWFRLSGLNIYYSSTVSDINILGSISIATVVGLINLENDHSGYYCFIIKDNSGVEWKICSVKIEKRNTWVCAIQATLGVKQEPFCNGEKKEVVKIIDHNVSF
jgi:hypothetical protein